MSRTTQGKEGTTAAGDAARAPAGEAARHAPIAVQPGPRIAIPARVEQRSWVPVIALGAASAVTLAVAVGLTMARNNVGDDVDAKAALVLRAGGQCAQPPDRFVDACAEIGRAGRRGAAFGDDARVTYGAAGALAVATAAYVLWPRGRRPATRKVQASATFGSNHIALYARGAW
ncbi:hypothetical protein [Sorangium sp. So ce1078]|uniref:hypothetical protein n=1 Tax=Sorangium sp. So ce1078 TaxID=3133329 RepID=UPI003F64187F